MPYPQRPRLSLAQLEEVQMFLEETATEAEREALRLLLKVTPQGLETARIEAMLAQRLRMLASYMTAKE